MKILFALLLLFTSSLVMAEPPAICLKADQTFRGPFTDSPPLEAGENRVTLTPEQFAALVAFRKTNGAAEVVFNGTGFAFSPAEVARRQAIADREALAAKLDAGTLTAAEQRQLIKFLIHRIQKLEARLGE